MRCVLPLCLCPAARKSSLCTPSPVLLLSFSFVFILTLPFPDLYTMDTALSALFQSLFTVHVMPHPLLVTLIVISNGHSECTLLSAGALFHSPRGTTSAWNLSGYP